MHYFARLFIVDDEPRIVSSLQELLSDIGEVSFTTDPTQALGLIQETQPDLILLDVNMPGLDGFDLCKAIKQKSSINDIPVIFLTGSTADSAEDRAFEVGAVDCISKPFNISSARARIKTHLAIKLKNDELLMRINRHKENEEKFRALVESAADACYVLDLNGRFIEVNYMACKCLGYTRDEMLGLTAFDIDKNIDPQYAKQMWKNREPGEIAVVKSRHQRKNGSSFPVEVRTSTAFINSRKCTIALVRDVTEQHETEKIILESEAKYRTLFENSPDGIYLTNVDGSIIEANPAACRMLGMSQLEIIAKGRAGIVEDGAALQSSIRERALNGKVMMKELTFIRKDGSRFPVEVSSAILTDYPDANRALVIARDITERKKNEAILRESEEKFKLLVDSATDAYFVSDTVGKLLEANRLACISLGYSRSELLKMNVLDIDQNFDAEEAITFWSGIELGQVVTFESRHRRKDGSIFPVEVRSSLQLINGEHQFISLARDITTRKQMEEALRQSREQFRIMGETIPYGVWRCNAHGEVEYVSPSFLDLLQMSIDQTREFGWIHHLPPEDEKPMRDKWLRCVEAGEDWNEEYSLLGPDGEYRTVLTRGKPVRDENSNIVSWVGINLDITDRKRAEEELKLAATVYQDSSEAMMVTDENNNVISVNKAFYDITGYTPDEVIGQNPSILRSGYHDKNFYRQMWRQINSAGRFKGELWNKKKNGEFFAVLLTINMVTDKSGKPHRYVGLMTDITEKKKSDDLIWRQANFDALTNLPNRRYFRDKLEHEIRNAKRSGQGIALLFLDLDGFKDVNDTLGHDMGDLILKVTADRLRDCVRETDTVARLGGDEFTVILTELHDKDNIDRIAANILHALSQPVQLGEQFVYMSASIGITLYPQDNTKAENLIRNADQAMYSAKQGGKNQFHYFTQELQNAALARLLLISDLGNALEKNQFEIYYQPVVELSSGVIIKAEALIRWKHPVKGMIDPIDFISTAENTGMINSFSNWIFQEAARQVADWRDRYHPAFQISVNISPVQFRKDGINSLAWLEHLKSLGCTGEGIVVEITEGILQDASEKVKNHLQVVRDAGIKIALDDFGTGHSSLAHLNKFGLDYIKIDRTFVNNLNAHSEEMTLCEAIISMAHKFGIKVIAEGVETVAQYELLANCECDYAQGYFFSRPVTASSLEELLKSRPFSSQKMLSI